jgi:hypothetical protein
MIAAFKHLEQFGLTLVFRRMFLDNRHIALVDVILLVRNNHLVDGRNVVVRIVASEFCFGSDNTGTSGKKGGGNGCKSQNSKLHLFYPFFFVEANSLIPKSKLFKCDIFGEGSDVTNSLQPAKKNT